MLCELSYIRFSVIGRKLGHYKEDFYGTFTLD
jgi:hypothetical protein